MISSKMSQGLAPSRMYMLQASSELELLVKKKHELKSLNQIHCDVRKNVAYKIFQKA